MIALLLFWAALPAVFETAQPGYRYQFPRDHFSHPAYQTEWWYYTGNVRTQEGRRFGFELTFFRHALYAGEPKSTSPWEVRNLYMAHFALTDINRGKFYSAERLNRPGPGVAGASFEQKRYWNGNWEARWSENRQTLRAIADDFSIDLELTPAKHWVVQGRNGISEKSSGHASHYISYPRLSTKGVIQVKGQKYEVTGLSWRDQEFFSGEMDTTLAGWDWFSVHLNNGDDLMLYRLRNKEGAAGAYTAGTYIDANGSATPLSARDLQFIPGRAWTSPVTTAAYPVEWKIDIPALGFSLDVRPQLDDQELVSKTRLGPSYWEGAVTYSGQKRGAPVAGEGYLEMTGYDKRPQFSSDGKFAVR